MHEVICSYLQASKIQMREDKKRKTNKNVDTILDEFLSQNEQQHKKKKTSKKQDK